MEKYCLTFSNISDYQSWLMGAKYCNIISTFVIQNMIVVTYTKEEISFF